MELKNDGMNIRLHVTAEDVDQAVRNWFSSRGFVDRCRRWRMIEHSYPDTDRVCIISINDRGLRYVRVAEWSKRLMAWLDPFNGTPVNEDTAGKIVAWMDLPEPYLEDY